VGRSSALGVANVTLVVIYCRTIGKYVLILFCSCRGKKKQDMDMGEANMCISCPMCTRTSWNTEGQEVSLLPAVFALVVEFLKRQEK
jgi:hypothetical protein